MKRTEAQFFAITVCAGFMLYLGFMGQSDQSSSVGGRGPASTEPAISFPTDPVETRVNQNLTTTARTIDVTEENLRAQFEHLPQIGEQLRFSINRKVPEPISSGLDLEGDRSEDALFGDLRRHDRDYSLYQAPNSVVQKELAIEQREQIERQERKDAFIRQYVENARRAGYKIKLNNDLVVLSVEKIPPHERLPSQSTNAR